jgi:hypothetical protein
MFELVCYLVGVLLIVAGLSFFTGKTIGGLKPSFGKNRPPPSKNNRMIAGSVCLVLAAFFAWMGYNALAVTRWLTMG